MSKRFEILKRPEYWFEYTQNELFRQVSAFMDSEEINQTELAERLGVSKGYVSQILNGTSNFTIKKLIEISLVIGKVPEVVYTPIEAKVQEDFEGIVYQGEFVKGVQPTLRAVYTKDGKEAAYA